MMPLRRKSLARFGGLASLALFGAIVPLQARIDVEMRAARGQENELLIGSGPLLRKLSLGYDSLLADIYWTRAVQYYGAKLANHDPDLELLAPLLSLTTSLDPNLIVAYKFGAIFLAEPKPVGLGRPDLAADLVRRGIAENPDEWSLWANLGFIYYWYEKDYAGAADAYLEGSKQPGAQDWMRGMAAKIVEEGGSYANSMRLWANIYHSSREPALRQNALKHLQTLNAEVEAMQLESLALEFKRRTGRYPANIRELIANGLIRGVPADPLGYPFVLEPGGKARLNPASPIESGILRPVVPR